MEYEELVERRAIRTVVLVGRHDFGRCPLAARVPTALWPIAGRPVVERLLDHLADEGIKNVVVCSESDLSVSLQATRDGGRLDVTLVTEDLTGGTAGCLRDAVGSDPGDLVMLLSGSMASPPPIRSMIEAHQAGGAELTMVFNPGSAGEAGPGAPAEIYLCKPEVLRLIPSGGYSDIKEGLIPAILRDGKAVRPLVLPNPVGNFHDRKGYLKAASIYLTETGGTWGNGAEVASDASIHPSARISGPVVIANGACVQERAVVVGPALVGPRVVIGRDAVVARSVLWGGVGVGTGCQILESIVDCETEVPDRTAVIEKTVSRGGQAVGGCLVGEAMESRKHRGGKAEDRIGIGFAYWRSRLSSWGNLSLRRIASVLGLVAVLGAFLWSYWPTFVDLRRVWLRSDEYSAGMLVPLLALYALWSHRRDIARVPIKPAVMGGVIAFLLAQSVRGLGLLFMYRSGERLSIILSAAAVVLLLGGWRFLRKLAPVLLFLCLMLPWPNRIQSAISLPLQGWATTSAVFCLELTGYEVLQDGNVIKIGETSVAVAEACNGLRMITAFFVISGLVVLLARRAWWAKLIVLISSLPIAMLCNTLRLTITAVAFTKLEGQDMEKLFHDFGGFAMMPLALAMVVGELWLLTQLTTPRAETVPAVITRRRPQHVSDA